MRVFVLVAIVACLSIQTAEAGPHRAARQARRAARHQQRAAVAMTRAARPTVVRGPVLLVQ